MNTTTNSRNRRRRSLAKIRAKYDDEEQSFSDYDNSNDGNDVKNNSKNNGLYQRVLMIVAFILAFIIIDVVFMGRKSTKINENTSANELSTPIPPRVTTKIEKQQHKGEQEGYNVYPFLVNSAQGIIPTQISRPLPKFPLIDRLENCEVSFPQNSSQVHEHVRTDPNTWRKMFWLPSFAGCGASNPSNRGNLLKEVIESITNKSSIKPIKDYHMSMRKKLRRCKGMSETIGCTNGHPMVPVTPEKQTQNFRSEVIVAIRNPSTAIPAFFTYKNIAYHKATKQCPQKEWNELRDNFFQLTFQHYLDVIKFWRKTTNTGNQKKNDNMNSYYRTVMYVPFEDIVTTDITTGTSVIRNLTKVLRSGSLSGRSINVSIHGNDTVKKNAFNVDAYFETTTSESDIECVWYRTAKKEWNRQQEIIGDYIPTYTQEQKDMMIQNLTILAFDIENEIQHGSDDYDNTPDLVLISLLRRYADQIKKFV